MRVWGAGLSEFVFSTLPLSVETLVSQEDLGRVRGVFEALAPGEWVTAARIQLLVGWERQRTAERTRKAVKELQLAGFPIVECHAGFAVAQNVGMVDRCLERELARMQGLARTIEALRRIREHMRVGQEPLVYYQRGAGHA